MEERLADFDETDKEQDDSLAQPSAIQEFGHAGKRWVDLSDSSDEEDATTTVQPAQRGKLAWADLSDSEGEEHTVSVESSEYAAWTDGQSGFQSAPAATSAKEWKEAEVEPKAKKGWKAALPSRAK